MNQNLLRFYTCVRGMMLKLKLQYFGYLMWRSSSVVPFSYFPQSLPACALKSLFYYPGIPRKDWTRQRLKAEWNYEVIAMVCVQVLDIQKQKAAERATEVVSSDIQTKRTGPGHWKEKAQIKEEASTQHSLSTQCMQCIGNANKTNAQPQTLKKPEGGRKSRTTLLTATVIQSELEG